MQCKAISDRLPYTNPDRSLAYCGLGSVLFNTEEWKISLRAFLKAREIREKLYGAEHADTAATFNNLGCCMFMLERNHEALAYFKLAHAILECELGSFHNRTMTAARNIKKTEKG
jgi:tetratricopeptide (TPR) repeat protein